MLKNDIKKTIGTSFQFENERVKIHISCYSKDTKNGFKHYTDFISIDFKNTNNYAYPLDLKNRKELKINYYNRTWESYQFQTLILHVLEWLFKNKFITEEEMEEFKKEAR